MIVRRLSELGPDRVVENRTWTSRRLLLRGDGMGFSMHDTILRAGTTTKMHYRNHLEAVYCIEGKGKIVDRGTGEEHVLEPGTIYALNDNDEHTVVAEEDLRMVCVFNPAVLGPENHDDRGGYALLDDDGHVVKA